MRRSIITTAAAGLTLVLAACGGTTGSEDSTEPEESETTAGASGTLTVWADELRAEPLADIAAQFETDTGVTVEIVQQNFDDIRPQFLAQAPTGEGPDIIVGAHDWAGELVTNGVVSPVELGDRAGEFSQVAVDGFTYDGSVYGVPYGIENIALVRNNDLASQTPETFDELIAQGEDSGAEYPVLLQTGEEGDAYHLYPLQTSFGAEVFATDDSGSYVPELTLGSDGGTAFAEWLATVGQTGSGALDTAITADIAKEAFANGESPYIITGPWNISTFTDAGLDVSVLPIPSAGGETAAPFVGVQGFYVSAYSENAILANEFLVNYVATEEVQVALYESGGRIPALTAAADTLTEDPIISGFAAAGEVGVPMPSLAEMNSVWEFWGTTQAAIISGAADDPAAAWETMVGNIQGAIDAA
ncbi:sugar ABC transporter substrate-binding protein [Ruania alba]|uniref:Carbohydrate ABC transporter substrate-binding protein, CUT1 family n=1 Tax=Ruania alba TaxID=648782 RepID=A0A1H5F7T9_9MICO|nr:maltose ABC transporter substrate-binding protein [Ruania alba]SED99451.1 carbohydrate ABC transporter substrate-binding protein, CUT1 family [Ruania alba]